MLHLDYRDVRPIYAQIVDGFREKILSGVLQEGDRLPSVRELAQELAINPNTIQRAYRELEIESLITTVPGKGCFVSATGKKVSRQLLDQFDRTVSALIHQGLSPEELIKRIGGHTHA